MRPADTSDLWWRTAVIYCLDVETFQDSDGDGIGDLEGLANRIDYLAEVGVTCLWLMPFQPTRDLDDGYDVTDFYGVDPRLGDLGHVVEVLRVAHGRGLRVIVDLVVNHTSDRHPWFVSARRSRNSRYRDYYVWRDRPPPGDGKHPVFPGEEDGVWEKDGGAQLPFYARNLRTVTQWAVPLSPGELMPRLLELQREGFGRAPAGAGTPRSLQVAPDRVQSHGLNIAGALGRGGTGLVWTAVREGEVLPRTRRFGDAARPLRPTRVGSRRCRSPRTCGPALRAFPPAWCATPRPSAWVRTASTSSPASPWAAS